MDTKDTKTLEYIFPRARMQDPFDNSWWASGDVRKLATLHADRLLRHPDCWAETTKKAKLHPSLTVRDDEEEQLEQEEVEMDMPQLEGMTKEQLSRYAKAEFDFELDGAKLTKADMQKEVRNLLASRRH